jgi:hypothetical protein
LAGRFLGAGMRKIRWGTRLRTTDYALRTEDYGLRTNHVTEEEHRHEEGASRGF